MEGGELGHPTGQVTIHSLRTREGGRRVSGGSRREVGGEEEVEILIGIIYKAIKREKSDMEKRDFCILSKDHYLLNLNIL